MVGGKSISDNDHELKLNKLVYYSSTLSLIRLLAILSLVLLGGILIFRSTLIESIEEYYVRNATIALWIAVIGCGITYYRLLSNFKKSVRLYGPEEQEEPESVKRSRIFGSSRFEYLSVLLSICMVALGLWFGGLYISLGLLNP